MNTYAYAIRHRGGRGTSVGPTPTHCALCSQPLPTDQGYESPDAEPVSKPDFPLPPLKLGERVERSRAVCRGCCGGAP